MDEDVIFIPVDADASDDIPVDTVHDSDSSSAGDPEIPDASILTSRGRHCCKSACVERFHDDQNLRDQHAVWLGLVRSQSKPVQEYGSEQTPSNGLNTALSNVSVQY